MAKGTNKEFSRQIAHTRLFDDGSLETRYEILNKLGEGSFGNVYRVKNKETNIFYAMKTIPKKFGNKSQALSLDNEVKLLTEVNHANLIQLHEVLESSQNLHLIIELCDGGELSGYIKQNGPLPEETVKQIMSKLINALYYLHKIDVVHRDLKLENILLKNSPTSKTDEFDIRVTDFGLSSKQSITSTDSLFHDYCGTLLYMAPEILENKNYSALCDVWAMGIIMYYLICARHPYVANDGRQLLERIRLVKLRFDSEKFRNLSSEGLDFLQGMLVYDTVHRRTMGELTVHPWLTGRFDRRPTKDIITMMKEFQAENDRHQLMTENNLTALINATANYINPSLIISDQSEKSSDCIEDTYSHSNQARNNTTTLERRSNTHRSKSHMKTNPDTLKVSKRSTNALHNIHSASSNIHVRIKENGMLPDVTDTSQNRQTFNLPSSTNLPKLQPGHIRLGRSRSQTDRPYSYKLSHQQQRTVLNGSIDVHASPASHTLIPSSSGHKTSIRAKTSPTSTMTALMMINKQYSNNSPSSLPFISNHHQHNTRKISFYDKRHSNT